MRTDFVWSATSRHERPLSMQDVIMIGEAIKASDEKAGGTAVGGTTRRGYNRPHDTSGTIFADLREDFPRPSIGDWFHPSLLSLAVVGLVSSDAARSKPRRAAAHRARRGFDLPQRCDVRALESGLQPGSLSR